VFGIRTPGAFGQDLSLKRSFGITEKIHLALQADAVNVFNLVTFSAPGLTITSSSFGKITGQSNGPRALQLSARVSF
jgi:hypothetical protein